MEGRRALQAAFDALMARVAASEVETGAAFPFYARDDGAWVTTEDGNWCAGHWIGLLWIAARAAGPGSLRDRLTQAGMAHVTTMRGQKLNNLFAGMNHHYAGFWGYDRVGEEKLREVGFVGAGAMLDLYNEKARQIPIGEFETFGINKQTRARPGHPPPDRRYVAAVDIVHTSLPVLWRAWRETGEQRYRDVAIAHAQRHLEWHIRPDGSVKQKTVFDPATGRPLRDFSSLAHTDDGCWARGIGWHIAGMAEAWLATGDVRYVDALNRSAAFYVEHAGEGLVPAWDLTHPDALAERDTSAAAITAYGLTVSARDGTADGEERRRLAERILDSLQRDHQRRDGAPERCGGILHGCYSHPSGTATDNELIWTDFYVAAALEEMLHPLAPGDRT